MNLFPLAAGTPNARVWASVGLQAHRWAHVRIVLYILTLANVHTICKYHGCTIQCHSLMHTCFLLQVFAVTYPIILSYSYV